MNFWVPLIVIALCALLPLGRSMQITVEAGRPSVSGFWRADDDGTNLTELVNEQLEPVEETELPETNTTTNNGNLDGPIDGTPEECAHGSYYASTTNCSTFHVCNQGKLTEGNCPPHFWFDPNHRGDMLCNYPEVVCAADNNVCDCAAQYPPLPPDPLIESEVACLADNRFHFVGSRVDCGRYFVCFNENVRRLECRDGFHYNPKTETCDYPELVNCMLIDPECPAEGVTFLSHQDRDDAFYFCFHGYKSLQTCTFYHRWDPNSKSCRRRDALGFTSNFSIFK